MILIRAALMALVWVLLGSLSGCATTAKYEEILDSWLGSDVNRLVDSWGYPHNTFEAPNGNTVYVYMRSQSYKAPEQTSSTYNAVGNSVYGNSVTTGGYEFEMWCKTYFEVNNSKRIIKYRWEGNSCYAK